MRLGEPLSYGAGRGRRHLTDCADSNATSLQVATVRAA